MCVALFFKGLYWRWEEEGRGYEERRLSDDVCFSLLLLLLSYLDIYESNDCFSVGLFY